MESHLETTEKWLDEIYTNYNTTEDKHDLIYYRGARQAVQSLGYTCRRDKNGKHSIL